MLVLHPVEDADGDGDAAGDGGSGHRAVLYFRPLAGRDTEEFYADSRYGEFWVGARPTLEELETLTGICHGPPRQLRDALAKDVGDGGVAACSWCPAPTRRSRPSSRRSGPTSTPARTTRTSRRSLSELRLVKDA